MFTLPRGSEDEPGRVVADAAAVYVAQAADQRIGAPPEAREPSACGRQRHRRDQHAAGERRQPVERRVKRDPLNVDRRLGRDRAAVEDGSGVRRPVLEALRSLHELSRQSRCEWKQEARCDEHRRGGQA